MKRAADPAEAAAKASGFAAPSAARRPVDPFLFAAVVALVVIGIIQGVWQSRDRWRWQARYRWRSRI